MQRLWIPLAAAILVLTAAPAFGIGLTGNLDELAVAASDRRAELEGVGDKVSAKAVKAIDKIFKALDNPKIEVSYADELKFAAKAVKSVEKSLPTLQGLKDLADAAYLLYEAEMVAARAALEADQGQAAAKVLAKVDKTTAKIALTPVLSKKLKLLSKNAKVLGAYVTFPERTSFIWVISQLQVAPSGVGEDVHGDEDGDNGLADALGALNGLGFNMNNALSDGLKGEIVALILMWDVQNFDDDEVQVSVIQAVDTDGKSNDNFTGTETFLTGEPMDGDGHPIDRVLAILEAGGALDVTPFSQGIQLGGFSLPEEVAPRFTGNVAPNSVTGQITFAMAPSVLRDYMELNGTIVDLPTVEALADWDTDMSGTPDMFTATLTFTAVPARLTAQ